jgi:enoyl-[acyl-carrier protein] reductase II
MIAGTVNALGTDEGRMEESFVWAGQSVGLIDGILPAGEVVRRMAEEARAGMERLRACF